MTERTTISLTGGGGHLGSCLTQMLLKNGYLVNALYYHSLPSISHPNLTWIKGDITNPDSLNDLFTNSSVMIHCASMISIGDKDEQAVYNINVHGTENVINACLKLNIKMIYISSSVAVIETKENEVFDEDRPYKTENDFLYPWTKVLSEKNVLSAVKNNNLDAFIIRPTAIVGPPDFKPSHFGSTILDLADNKIPAITSGGYNLVDVRDLSQTIINSLHKGEKGEVYLVGGNYYNLKQIAKMANSNRNPICISLNLLICILPIINFYKKLFPLRWAITKESLITLKYAPKQMDCSKAKNKLGHTVRPLTETILDLIIWFRKQQNS